MTAHTCPRCRFQFCDEDVDRDQEIAERVAAWTARCADQHLRIRGGYVTESVAAELLGIGRALSKHRRAGTGPRYRDVDGCPVSYHLTELAAWEAAHQEGNSWK